MGRRIVLPLKTADCRNPTPKARFVIQGLRDRGKGVFNIHVVRGTIFLFVDIGDTRVHDTSTSVGRSCHSGILQSDTALAREVHITPPPEMKLKRGHIRQIVMDPYGITDAGDYCNKTLQEVLTEKMEMRSSPSDPAPY